MNTLASWLSRKYDLLPRRLAWLFAEADEYDAGDVCLEMHPHAPKVRLEIPVAPFRAMRCSACSLYTTDWGVVKTFIWLAIFGWWWEGEKDEKQQAYAPAISRKRELV
jgi:hypothetical protein